MCSEKEEVRSREKEVGKEKDKEREGGKHIERKSE